MRAVSERGDVKSAAPLVTENPEAASFPGKTGAAAPYPFLSTPLRPVPTLGANPVRAQDTEGLGPFFLNVSAL
jgi:hypothetical protein